MQSIQGHMAAMTSWERIIDCVGDGLFLLDGSGTVIAVNRAYEVMSGFSREEIVGTDCVEVARKTITAGDLDRVLRVLRDALEGKDIPPTRTTISTKDGREKPIYYSTSFIRKDDGKPEAIVSVIKDISDVTRAEELLQESERRFEAFMDNSHFISWMKDEHGRIVYLSKPYERRFGVRLEDVRGKTDFEIWPEDVAEQFWKNDQLILQSWHPSEMVEQALNPDGSTSYWWNMKFPFQDAMRRRYVGGIGIDITEHRLIEETLREREQLLIATQALSKVGGWEWDVQNKTMVWTKETYRIHGMVPGECAPGSPEHIEKSEACYAPEARAAIMDAFRRCCEQGTPYDMELPFTNVQGRAMWVRTKAEALFDGDRVVKVNGNIMDITERRQVEEELRRHRDYLDDMVRERTAEVTRAYQELELENRLRKKKEAALRARERQLKREQAEVSEVNTALKVLLKHREEDKIHMGANIASNIKVSIVPFLKRLEDSGLGDDQRKILSIVKSGLEDISSPFIRKVSSEHLGLTPSELKVATLIREGKTSKEIAELLHVSYNTTITHRSNVRKKLGLSNKKENLRLYLQSLD